MGYFITGTVDAPLQITFENFADFFSYLFKLKIQYIIFLKYHFKAIYVLFYLTNLIIWNNIYENVSIWPQGSILKPKAQFPVQVVFTCLYN